jgi:carbonic anhydrase/acetyltransferase-like protein (isoleucine patch superfamily)
MIRTNIDDLVVVATTGYISAPALQRSPYRPDTEGIGTVLIGMSGIVYNARVGDPAYGWAGDHVEPGVSIAHPDFDVDHAMHYLTCIGNEAMVMSGLAAGEKGIVTGEHARMLVDFSEDVLEQLSRR